MLVFCNEALLIAVLDGVPSILLQMKRSCGTIDIENADPSSRFTQGLPIGRKFHIQVGSVCPLNAIRDNLHRSIQAIPDYPAGI
jgi:hypothetical protein